jgi:hypothetical protein
VDAGRYAPRDDIAIAVNDFVTDAIRSVLRNGLHHKLKTVAIMHSPPKKQKSPEQ